jgi:hypothetical protein
VVLSIAALVALAAQTPKVTLTYFQEHFIVREGVYNESAPLKLAEETPRLSTLFRKNSTFAVWDERGLTIRVGPTVKSTKLPDISLSPKAFSRAEILSNLAEMRKGRRTKDVAGLSGAVRVGNRVYFLARWEDKDGKPWAEALVRVDLTDKFPEPKFVTRQPSISIADQPVGDQLFIMEDKVSYIARDGGKWGIEQFDTQSDRSTFEELGGRLETYVPIQAANRKPQTAPLAGYFVERTSYGTTVAGRVDLKSRTRKNLAEGRMKMRFMDGQEPPCLIRTSGNTATILNASTGAEFDLPVPCAARRMSRGIVVWTPVEDPKRAWLYDPRRWQGLTWWNSELSPGGDGG